MLPTAAAKEISRRAHGRVRGLFEARIGTDQVRESVVPDFTRLLPGEASKRFGDEIKGMIGNAGVDMDATVVGAAFEVVFHVGRLRVFAQARVVIGRAGRLHRAERNALDAFGQKAGADEPIGLVCRLSEFPLLDQGAEDVGERLVERAWLVVISEVGLELGDAVSEPFEDDAVAISINHLRAVPEGVVIVERIMDRRIEPHAVAIDGISPENPAEKIVGRPGVVVGLVDVAVFAPGIALVPDQRAGQSGPVVQVVDGSAFCPRGRGESHGAQVSEHVTLAAQPLGMLERLQDSFAQLFGSILGQVAEHVGGDDRADRTAGRDGALIGVMVFPHKLF